MAPLAFAAGFSVVVLEKELVIGLPPVKLNTRTDTNEDTIGRRQTKEINKYFLRINDTSVDNAEKRIVWLISFPNSGTSYTSKLVKRVSGISTATNYGEESLYIDPTTGGNIPVISSSPSGPFWSSSRASKTNNGLILTKTHCGGRCVNCPANEYLSTLDTFYNDCRTAKRYATTFTNTTTKLNTTTSTIVKKYHKELELVKYDAEKIVSKAIHLIRNPISNIVARFHLAHKRSKKKGEEGEFSNQFPNNKEGFREWCHYLDTKESYVEAEQRHLSSQGWSEDVIRAFEGVPCHADFFRYAQWHNLAFETVAKMQIPELAIRYENYETTFDYTLQSILNFLEITSAVGKPKSFVSGKTYADYFTEDEIGKAEELLRLVSSAKTWDHVKLYF